MRSAGVRGRIPDSKITFLESSSQSLRLTDNDAINPRKGDIMNTKRWATFTVSMLALCALLALAACSKKENTEQSNSAAAEQQAAPATPIDPATVATVSGTVKFDGTAPKAAKIDMSQDPGCKGTNTAEAVVVDNGDLANVFVYVKDGLGSRTFDTPKDPVVIEQKGCQYHPHVLGVMTGQTVAIRTPIPPPTTSIPRRKTIASGMNHSRLLRRTSRKTLRVKRSCCR
jgi:hypothetical protein